MTPPDESEIETMLAAMLAPPERPGDRVFTARVDRAIDVQAALLRAERRFWRSFAFEALAIGALLAALWLLSSSSLLAPLAGSAQWGLAPPLLLILALWFVGTQRLRQT
jgi:fatty acid desaturase